MDMTAYERTWIEGLNRGDVSVADQAFAPDCVIHINGSPEPNLSLGGFKDMLSGLLGAFPDLRITIEDDMAEGDKVVTRWIGQGTHQGELMGVAPTGNQLTFTGITIHRIEATKIVEEWSNWDALGLMQQIGAVPTPEQSEEASPT